VGEKLRFLDLFAGIGGFRLALEQAGHKCVGFCEIDEFARQIYKANFDTEGEVDWEDITEVTDSEARELRGKVDLITGGFPCQAFSVAGKRRGFEDTRGTMFFEIARIAKQIEPRFLLLENVKGLLSHDKGRTFAIILSTLDELGYDVEWQVLNSKDFGVPQNRERVFIVGHSRRFPRREVFPLYGASPEAELKFIGGIETAKRWLDDGKNHSRNFSQGHRVYDVEGLSTTLSALGGGLGAKTGLYAIPVLTPDRLEKRQNGRRFKDPGEPMFTLTAQDRHGVMVRQTEDGFHLARNDEKKSSIQGTHVTYPQGKSHCLGTSHVPMTIEGVRIRRLTPLECFRLQGFPDEHFHNAKAAGVSDNQLYKQAGNAVTVNVVYEIAKRFQND
jgi:DNA (cytosine-5)-methyltransferase 1